MRGGLRPQGGLPNRAGVHRPPGGRLPRGGRGRLDCPAHPPAGGGRLHRHGQGGGAARHLRGLLRAAAQRQPVRPRLRPRAPGPRGACPGQRGGGLFPGGGDRRHALLAAGDRQPQPGHPPAGGADEPPVRLHRRRRGPPAPGEPGRQRVRLPAAGGGGPAPLRPGGPGAGPVPGRGGHHALRRLFKLPLHQNRLPGHGPGHGGRPPAPGQPAPAGEVCPGLRVLRLPRGVGVCAVFGQAAGQRLGFAGGGALPPGQGRRDGDEHPQVQGAGVPRVHCGGLRPQLRLGPAGRGAAPPRAGPGGQAAGPGALGPVYHHRPGGHRPGDSPCLRRGGAARPLRGADPRQGEAAAGGLLGGPGAHRGKAGPGAHRGRARPLHRAPGQKRRPVAAAVRPVPPRRRGPAPGCRGPGGLRLLAGLHPLGHPFQPVPARGGGPSPGSPHAPAPRLAAVPPPAAADCLCLPPPGGGGHPGQGGGLQAGGGAGRQPGHHPLPARLAGRAGHDPRRAGHGPPRLYAVRGLCRRPPRPGEGAGPPGGPGAAHPGAGGRGGPAPGAEVFGKPPGPAGAPLPPGGEGAPLHRGDTRRPGAAGGRQWGGGHPPGGGGLHLCGGRTAAHHRFQDRPGADHGGALAALPGPAAAVRLRHGGGLRPAGGAAGAVLHLAGAGQRPGL